MRFVGGATFRGVQADYVRRVKTGPGDEGVVLIPALFHSREAGLPPEPDVLCLWRTDYFKGKREGGGRACSNAGQIQRGAAIDSVGHRVDMVVPDGVTGVTATGPRGRIATARPRDNVASWRGSLPETVRWTNARGRSLRVVRY